MTIKHYRDQFIQELTPLYDAGEAESFFYLILEAKHQLKRVDLALQPDLVFSKADLEIWNSILEQLKKVKSRSGIQALMPYELVIK
mgnify:CR=1 FL=1